MPLAPQFFRVAVKRPQQPTALTNRLALSVVQDAAEWKRAFFFVHSLEAAQHAAGFFMTELLAAGELYRLLQGRAGCSMSFW